MAEQPSDRRQLFTKENFWIVLLSYVLIILFARVFLYFSSVRGSFFEGIFIRGTHYHHYFWGYVIFVLGLLLYREVGGVASLVCIGAGLGYVFDEILMFFSRGAIWYWSYWNLATIVLGLLVLNALFFLIDGGVDEDPRMLNFNAIGKRMRFFSNFAQKALVSKVGPVRNNEFEPFAIGYVLTLVAFVALVGFVLFAAQDHMQDHAGLESQSSIIMRTIPHIAHRRNGRLAQPVRAHGSHP